MEQACPDMGGNWSNLPRPPAREASPNYITSLLCRETVDGSQEAVGRGPTDNFFISQMKTKYSSPICLIEPKL